MNPHRLRAYILLLIVAIIWGIAGPVIKLTLKGFPADVFLFYRFFLSSLVAMIIFLFKGIKLPTKISTLFLLLIYCFIQIVTLGFLFWGLEKTSLIDMSLISIFGPILVILNGWLFLREHITKREKVGIVITFFGSLLIITEPLLGSHLSSDGRFIGNLLILASLVISAGSSVILKKLLREKVDPLTLTNLTFIIGFLTLIPLIMVKTGLGSTLAIIKNASLPYQLGAIYMAIFSGTIAYTLGNIAQKTIEISEAALFSYLYPIISAVLAVFLLGEKLTPPAAIGSIIIFLGIALAELKTKRVAS